MFILALKGFGKQDTARMGNIYGTMGMVRATALVDLSVFRGMVNRFERGGSRYHQHMVK